MDAAAATPARSLRWRRTSRRGAEPRATPGARCPCGPSSGGPARPRPWSTGRNRTGGAHAMRRRRDRPAVVHRPPALVVVVGLAARSSAAASISTQRPRVPEWGPVRATRAAVKRVSMPTYEYVCTSCDTPAGGRPVDPRAVADRLPVLRRRPPAQGLRQRRRRVQGQRLLPHRQPRQDLGDLAGHAQGGAQEGLRRAAAPRRIERVLGGQPIVARLDARARAPRSRPRPPPPDPASPAPAAASAPQRHEPGRRQGGRHQLVVSLAAARIRRAGAPRRARPRRDPRIARLTPPRCRSRVGRAAPARRARSASSRS